jgi:hypothetical protein
MMVMMMITMSDEAQVNVEKGMRTTQNALGKL